MSWAANAKEKPQRNESAQIRPRGHSMTGKVDDGDPVTLPSCDPETRRRGDRVLVRVPGTAYLHLIKVINQGRCLIGNNRGGTYGWVGKPASYGRAIKVEAK